MGFYVQVEDTSSYKVYKDRISSFDIYLIDDEYKKTYPGELVIPNIEKSILVYIPKSDYFDDNLDNFIVYQKDNQKFMMNFLKKLLEIYTKQKYDQKRWLDSSKNLSKDLSTFLEQYFSSNLLFHKIYGSIYDDNKLGKAVREDYVKMIEKYNVLVDCEPDNDLLKSILYHSRYELAKIEMDRQWKRLYSIRNLDNQVDLWYSRNRCNEEASYFHALVDLIYEFYSEAGNCFGDKVLIYNPDALHQRGKLIKFCEPDAKAMSIAYDRWAIHYKKDYFQAWYEIGESQRVLYSYSEAYSAYQKVLLILNDKLQRHLLSPIEKEYLCNSIIEILGIANEINIDKISYQQLLIQIVKIKANNKYLETVFPDIEVEKMKFIKEADENKYQKILKKLPDNIEEEFDCT